MQKEKKRERERENQQEMESVSAGVDFQHKLQNIFKFFTKIYFISQRQIICFIIGKIISNSFNFNRDQLFAALNKC